MTGSLLLAASLTLGACSSSPAASTPAAAATATAPTPAPPAAAALDAKTVLAALTAANIGVTNGQVQDENSDPNNLLGRPGKYTSRASFDLPGGDTTAKPGETDRGGCIEVWPDAAAAKARADYIQQQLKANPMLGAEYDYLAGPVLVRVAGKVKPSQAAKVQAAVATLG